MNLDLIHTQYRYHFALYEKLWASIDHLTDALFIADVPYSIGAVRNHVVHLMSVEQRWFARVLGQPLPDRLQYADYTTRAAARADWDSIMARLQNDVLHTLTEADLARPVAYEVRRPHGTVASTNAVWEILVHVVNHGTDHRSQLLRILHDYGAPTFEQDMVIYWWGEGN